MLKTDIPDVATAFMCIFNSPPWNEEWTQEESVYKITELYNLNNFLGLIVNNNYDEIIAFALGHHEIFHKERSYFLKEIGVSTSEQSNGIGTAILTELHDELSKIGISSVYLITDKGSIAEHFYYKNSYFQSSRGIILKKHI